MESETYELAKLVLASPLATTICGALAGSIPSIFLLILQNKSNKESAKNDREFKKLMLEDEWSRKLKEMMHERSFAEKRNAYVSLLSSLEECKNFPVDFEKINGASHAYAMVAVVGSNTVCQASNKALLQARLYTLNFLETKKQPEEYYRA